MSSYYNENGGGGGYGGSQYGSGGGGYGRPQHHRINEEDVPESKHTVFIRGLPGNMPTDEVKEYFDSKVGPCSFDFSKVSADRSRLFVAVRFENREHAKECMNKYKDADILGYPCELTWFRDIRRYASYQAAQQGGRGAALSNRRGNRGMYRNNSGRYDRGSFYDRKRRRSESGGSSRSRSRSRSGRASKSSKRSGSSRRSRSISRGRSSSRGSVESRKRDQSPDDRSDSEPRRIKKEKKQKRSKKEKRRRSITPGSGSEGELHSGSERRSPRKSRSVSREKLVVQRDRSESPLHVRDVKTSSNDKDIKISITMPPLPPNPPPSQAGKELHNTTISFGLEGDQPPKRIIRNMTPPGQVDMDTSQDEPEAPPAPPPPVPASIPTPSSEPRVIRPRFKPIETQPAPPKPSTPAAPPKPSTPPPPPSSTIPPPPPPSTIIQPQLSTTTPKTGYAHQIPQYQPSPVVVQKSKTPPPPPPSFQATYGFHPVETPAVPIKNETPISTPIHSNVSSQNSTPAFPPRQMKTEILPKRISELKPVIKEDKYPFTSKLLEGIKEYQSLIVEQIKYEPPEEEETGTLKLSSLSTMEEEKDEDEEMKALEREQKLLSLTSLQMDKVELKKKQLEKAFKGDCETFKIVTLKLLSKDETLEKSLRLAILQVFEDLEKQMIEKMDAFLAQF